MRSLGVLFCLFFVVVFCLFVCMFVGFVRLLLTDVNLLLTLGPDATDRSFGGLAALCVRASDLAVSLSV